MREKKKLKNACAVHSDPASGNPNAIEIDVIVSAIAIIIT